MKIIYAPKLGEELEEIPFNPSSEKLTAPYYQEGIQAGFPSPAEDFLEQRISLDEKYLSDYEATYLIRVVGESMYPTLQKGDILIVKANEELKHNQIVIVSVNNTDYTVKRYDMINKLLISDNDILICKGVVKQIIREI